MPDAKYERLPHAGDFERESGTEVFYLSPKPVPTGMPAFSGQNLHQQANEVFLDVGAGQASVEFAARCYIGSVMFLVIFLLSVRAAWHRYLSTWETGRSGVTGGITC